MKTTAQALKEYTLKSDKVSKIGIDKFEILRNGKIYSFEVETIIASGEIQKLHNRLIIKTNLPKLEIGFSKEEKEKIQKDLDKVNDWIKKNEKYSKGSDYFFKQKMKRDRLKSKLTQAE